MKSKIVLVFCFFSLHILNGQNGKLIVQIDKDTMYLNETVNVAFTIENCDSKFELPVFDHFKIVGGPNISTSITIINGLKSQKQVYTIQLFPLLSGNFQIPEVQILCDDAIINTNPVAIHVLNIDKPMNGLNNTEPHFFEFENSDSLPSNKSKIKRVLKKI